MALSGVDLVVELPTIASLSSSDYFATFAIKVAHYLDIDTMHLAVKLIILHALKR